jgi:hypothetical protein
MSLDQIINQKVLVKPANVPNEDILLEVQRGNRFIVVDAAIDPQAVPDGYTLISMKHKGEDFKALIPQSLLFFMANPGEGNPNEALDEIAGFYGNAKDFEDDLINEGKTSVQGANWATLARGSYSTYLVNRLVKHNGTKDDKGEPVPEFDSKVIANLDLLEDYVLQRIKAIAAVSLGKDITQIDRHEVRDVLKHVTINEERTEKLSREEFKEITCWAGSHYEIKDEYRNKEGVKYDIDRRHDMNHRVGVKHIPHSEYEMLDVKINELESQITDYRNKKHEGKIGMHDAALIRQYINLAYISKQNPKAQLDIQPPANLDKESKEKIK